MKYKKIATVILTLVLSLAFVPPKAVHANIIVDTYNAFIQAGHSIWEWISGGASGGGGTSRGGGVGRYVDSFTMADSSGVKYENGTYYYNITGNNTGNSQPIIDPVQQIINVPAGKVTNVGGGGESRGGGAGRYPISEIEYNPNTNEYTVVAEEVVNQTIQYITYVVEATPTYTQISYDVVGDTVTDRYYFKLPDGRNSWDMTADEIYGQPMLYDYRLYEKAEENAGTLALFHFNGDVKDASFNNAQFTYTNASYNYVSSGNFNQALQWSNLSTNKSVALNITLPKALGTDDYTIEFRLYANSIGLFQSANQDVAEYASSKWVAKNSCGSSCASPKNYLYFTRSAPLYYFDNYFTLNMGTKDLMVLAGYGIAKNYSSSLMTSQEANKSVPITVLGTYFADSGYNTNHEVTYQNAGNYNTTGSYETIALVRKDGVTTYYVNGQAKATFSDTTNHGNILSLQKPFSIASTTIYIDELRVTDRAIYLEDYVPATSDFTTNLVHVLPETGSQGQVAIKSDIEVTTVRWGGVKPTYPEAGSVYFMLANDIVTSIQQFDGADWLPVDAAIYDDNEWHNLTGYSLVKEIIDDDDYPIPTDPTDPIDPPDVPEGWAGIIQAIVEGFASVMSSLFDLTGVVITSFTSLFENLFIPDTQVINDKMNEFKGQMDIKLGLLGAPFDIFDSLMNRFMDKKPDENGVMRSMNSQPIISIPEIKIPIYDATIIEPTSINLNEIVSQEPLSNLYNYYLIFMDVCCYVWLIGLGKKKYDEITMS